MDKNFKMLKRPKKNKKLYINSSLFLNKILTIISFYLLLYSISGNSNNSNKFNNNNKTMKHAILLLSSYGINYMNNFLSQFNNDKRFDIFVHIDDQSKRDVANNKTITIANIKYINFLYKSEKYSTEMVDTMFKLLNIANKTGNYDYFHYFSDTCYLTTTLEEFYNFFEQNNKKTFIDYKLENQFQFNGIGSILYKGSQWMSLHKNIAHKLLENVKLFNIYKREFFNGTITLTQGAVDEFIFTHIIVNDICKRKPERYNIINNNLRFIKWENCNAEYCPNYLDQFRVSDEEKELIKKNNYLVIRKIDFKNPNAINLVNILKGK